MDIQSIHHTLAVLSPITQIYRSALLSFGNRKNTCNASLNSTQQSLLLRTARDRRCHPASHAPSRSSRAMGIFIITFVDHHLHRCRSIGSWSHRARLHTPIHPFTSEAKQEQESGGEATTALVWTLSLRCPGTGKGNPMRTIVSPLAGRLLETLSTCKRSRICHHATRYIAATSDYGQVIVCLFR